MPQIANDALARAGQPLDARTRASFEPRFGFSFANVRVHADGEAAAAAQAVDARAYTVGAHIVFDRGAYEPHSARGREVLAHELTHVVQNARSAAPTGPAEHVGEPDAAAEREAESAARRVTAGETVDVGAAHEPAAVRRLPFGIRLPGGIRGLDSAELAILTPVFGSSLDYGAIYVSDALGGGGRPFTTVLPLIDATAMQLGPGPYARPGSDPDLIIHEATHCWQSQHHPVRSQFMINSLASQAAAAAAGGDAYCYVPGKTPDNYGAEQAAQQNERGEPAIRSWLASVPAGVPSPSNVVGLGVPHWETPGAPGVKC